MNYKTIVPENMTNNELRSIYAEIQVAKNWGLKVARITLKNGNDYLVDVNNLKDYQNQFKTETNAIKI